MKFNIPSSYGQIYLCTTSIKDFPDWDDESFEKGSAWTKEGVSLCVADDADIDVVFGGNVPANFRYLDSVSLVSTDRTYELGSPLYLDNGAILGVEGDTLKLDIYVDSAHPESIKAVIFITSAKLLLVKPFDDLNK